MRSFQHGHGHHTELRTASFSLIQPILNPLQLPCSALIFVSTEMPSQEREAERYPEKNQTKLDRRGVGLVAGVSEGSGFLLRPCDRTWELPDHRGREPLCGLAVLAKPDSTCWSSIS
ncbi:uncharacterized protein LJ206_017218 isoform 1-T1 [Theristicus caerulescens]